MAVNEEIDRLKVQLATARNEIKNLRQSIQSLKHVHTTEIEVVRETLRNFNTSETPNSTTPAPLPAPLPPPITGNASVDITFKPIGTIKTVFPEKRGLPRQAVLCSALLSRIELDPELCTNPEHTILGLEEFSHIWIIYHFHKNSAHTKAKVAPPRLDGQAIGVLGTRSPHRPCPIGLSLVELDHIEKGTIYFRGTDMVNDTPVIDIKPYIPHYDSPSVLMPAGGTPDQAALPKRGAPDGQEADKAGAVGGGGAPAALRSSPAIKVPNWVLKQTSLEVSFAVAAAEQMQELDIDPEAIKQILKSDPRSVYLRTKYGSEVYTFQLGEHTVTCKFDDDHAGVEVIQIKEKIETENLSKCE